MITYRHPVPSDVIDLLSLIEEYCQDNNISYDLKSAKSTIDAKLGKLPAIVAVYNDEVVGVMSFIWTPHPYDNKIIVGRKVDCMLRKEYRDKGIGKELTQMAEKVCKDNGATKFYFSGTSPLEGYSIHETDYVKDL